MVATLRRCARTPARSESIRYTKKNDVWGIAPHITPKQFYELAEAGVIDSTLEDKKDKYGNIINFYEIARERES